MAPTREARTRKGTSRPVAMNDCSQIEQSVTQGSENFPRGTSTGVCVRVRPAPVVAPVPFRVFLQALCEAAGAASGFSFLPVLSSRRLRDGVAECEPAGRVLYYDRGALSMSPGGLRASSGGAGASSRRHWRGTQARPTQATSSWGGWVMCQWPRSVID